MAVRWGIWGTTTIAQEWVIDAIRTCGGDVVAVCGRDHDRAAAYAAKNGIGQFFTNPASFLDSGIDAVYVGTINAFHHEQVLAAAAAGKHVLCEKPLALSLEAGREMVEACRLASVTLAVNHHLRNAAPHLAIKEEIRKGSIGDIVSAAVTHAGYLPKHLQSWRINDTSAGAGAIFDLTVHDADLLHFILGAEPVTVVAIGGYNGLAQPGIEDSVSGVMKFNNGVNATFFDAFTTPFAQHRLEVHGTKGTLIAIENLHQTPGGRLLRRDSNGSQDLQIRPSNLYEPNIKAFHDAIRGLRDPIATGTDGLRSLAVALAVKRSIKTGTSAEI